MMPNKSTNKTSATLDRLSGFGDVLLSRSLEGGWEARLYSPENQGPEGALQTAFGGADTLDEALGMCLRAMEVV